jgi:hypothetical protein
MIEYFGRLIRGVVLARSVQEQIVLRDMVTDQLIGVVTVISTRPGRARLHCHGDGVRFIRAEIEHSTPNGGNSPPECHSTEAG